MYLINVKAFIERERVMSKGGRADRRTQVLSEFNNDEATAYAILSHRWTKQEVKYGEIVDLAKMKKDEQDEVRRRDGYRKIINSCEQAKRDGYEWLWVDTCCINKESSAELSEAINSMYRWYENSRVCYTYLHDVPASFPAVHDDKTYPDSNGWPEWFSRGWTLQEMIAPSNVQFFNKDWRPIGNKRSLSSTLEIITRVPQHILMNGLSSNRPCVAQIISWAADRTTARVEDRAYSLLGLLDVNMPMLYGEGQKAFHRLQLEIIHMSNDQSIFAWGSLLDIDQRIGSILADDPSFFRDCVDMELMDADEFIQYFKDDIPEQELQSIEEDRLGVFPVTNRGIQIWMFLRPLNDFPSVFQAFLPCRNFSSSSMPASIKLALWKSNYYRYFPRRVEFPIKLQFRQVYLRYQDTPHHNATFEINDSAIIKNSFTYCGVYPSKFTGNTPTLTSTDPLFIKVYFDSQADCRFAVGFGECFGQDWIHLVYEKPASASSGQSWEYYAEEEYTKMLIRGPEHAQSMAEARSGDECCDRVCVSQTYLPGSTWTVRSSCVAWGSSRKCGVKIEAFRYPGFGDVSGEWRAFDVDKTNNLNRDMRGLMICYSPRELRPTYTIIVDGALPMNFFQAPGPRTAVGDYGSFLDSTRFHREGNIFADLKTLAKGLVIAPICHEMDTRLYGPADSDYVILRPKFGTNFNDVITLYKPFYLSLPSNRILNLLLASLSPRLTNRYLVTRVVQSSIEHSTEKTGRSGRRTNSHRYPRLDTSSPSFTTYLCTFAKPLVWYRDEGADFASALATK